MGSDDIKTCSGCMDNFDYADIYDVDGEELCEGRKNEQG